MLKPRLPQEDEHMKKPWHSYCRRWFQVNLTTADVAGYDVAAWERVWRDHAVQGIIVNAGGIIAYYPSEDPLQERAPGIGDISKDPPPARDLFGEIVASARASGLVVVARMDSNRASPAALAARPDWFCRSADGAPLVSQGRYFTCIHSAYYRETIPARLREIIRRYRPDGFTDNSWRGRDRFTICHCDNCRHGFREVSGLELPERAEPSDPAYEAWYRWNLNARTELWSRFDAICRRAGGSDCRWSGMINADPVGAERSFLDLAAIAHGAPILFSDQQGRSGAAGHGENLANGLLLAGLAGPGVIIPESMATYVRGARTFRLAATPASEAQIWAAQGIAGGLSPWTHVIGARNHDRRRLDVLSGLSRWHAVHDEARAGVPAAFEQLENLADIGIVWSSANIHHYAAPAAHERFSLPYAGWIRALQRARRLLRPVEIRDVSATDPALRTLVLPHLAALSDADEERLLAWLAAGRDLVITGPLARLDEEGGPRLRSRLLEYLGLGPASPLDSPTVATGSDWERPDAHSYLRRTACRHPVLAAFGDSSILAGGEPLLTWQSTPDWQILATEIPAFPIYPPEFSCLPDTSPDTPALLARSFENGARVTLFAPAVDRSYAAHRLPDQGALLAAAIQRPGPVCVEGQGACSLAFYRQPGGCLQLHIVANPDPGCGPVEEAPVLGPYRLRFAAELIDNAAPAARLLVGGGELPLRDGCLELPAFSLHERIAIASS